MKPVSAMANETKYLRITRSRLGKSIDVYNYISDNRRGQIITAY
jgi:hypothetical protein